MAERATNCESLNHARWKCFDDPRLRAQESRATRDKIIDQQKADACRELHPAPEHVKRVVMRFLIWARHAPRSRRTLHWRETLCQSCGPRHPILQPLRHELDCGKIVPANPNCAVVLDRQEHIPRAGRQRALPSSGIHQKRREADVRKGRQWRSILVNGLEVRPAVRRNSNPTRLSRRSRSFPLASSDSCLMPRTPTKTEAFPIAVLPTLARSCRLLHQLRQSQSRPKQAPLNDCEPEIPTVLYWFPRRTAKSQGAFPLTRAGVLCSMRENIAQVAFRELQQFDRHDRSPIGERLYRSPPRVR